MSLNFCSLAEVLLLSLLLPSLCGIILLEVESLTNSAIIRSLLAGNLLLLIASRYTGRWQAPTVSSGPPLRVWAGLCLVLLFAAWLRLPAFDYVRGGQDPGVYVNIANLLARTGKLEAKDSLAELLNERPGELRKLYFKSSYRAMSCKTPEKCRGAFLPGFYLRGLTPSRIVPQFYHLHPVWMAYSHLFAGGGHTTSILPFFGLLCLLTFFLILREVCRDDLASLAGTLILACSPAYAYFARFPVSEITASLFFLASLLFLLRSRLTSLPDMLLAACFAGALFFTRITGFMTLALFYAAIVIWASINPRKEDRKSLIMAWSALAAFFVWSYLHGLNFSRPYSMEIWSRLGLPLELVRWSIHQPLLFAGLFLVLTLAPLLLFMGLQPRLAPMYTWLDSRRLIAILSCLAIAALLTFVVYKSWQLGFTDHYANNRWIGKRWHLAGGGWWSVQHLNFVVLALFASPLMLAMACAGWLNWCRRSLHDPVHLLLALCLAGLTAALTVKQLVAPYLYYFGRYLVSELLPLTILAGVCGLQQIRLKRESWSRALQGTILAASLACLLPPAISQARGSESQGLYPEMEQLAQAVGNRALLFVDEVNFARVELVTPLQISFGIPSITYSRRDYTGQPLHDLMKQMHSEGFDVFLLSEKDRGDTLPFLSKVEAFEFPLGSLIPEEGSIIPSVYRQGRQRAYLHRFAPLDIY